VGLPGLRDRDPALESHIAAKFAKVQALQDAQREGEGFKTYDKLNRAEVKELSDAASALSESGCPSWPPRSSENQNLTDDIDSHYDGWSASPTAGARGCAPLTELRRRSRATKEANLADYPSECNRHSVRPRTAGRD
jgi:hypothetical protein